MKFKDSYNFKTSTASVQCVVSILVVCSRLIIVTSYHVGQTGKVILSYFNQSFNIQYIQDLINLSAVDHTQIHQFNFKETRFVLLNEPLHDFSPHVSSCCSVCCCNVNGIYVFSFSFWKPPPRRFSTNLFEISSIIMRFTCQL